jgi:uncharacterized coiled-coil protein SlyX
MSSIRDIIFGEEITLFEALDQLEVVSLANQIDELETRVSLLDDNLRSLATTVDENHRQTQLQIQNLTTSIINMQSDVLTAINQSTLALSNSQQALSSANTATNIAISAQIQVNDLQSQISRTLRGGMRITAYRERDTNRSESISYILPPTGDIMSQTQYLCAFVNQPNTFIHPLTFAGAGDNSRNNITVDGPRYPIKEGANNITFGGNTSTLYTIRIQ